MKIAGCQPDSGKPTVRDERGACGNVGYGRTRNPLHIPKGCMSETLCLRLCAPYFYPTTRPCARRGNSGTGESRLSPCTSKVGGTDLSNRETPGDEEEAFALHRANKERRYKVSGEDSEERTSLRWAVGSLSGT